MQMTRKIELVKSDAQLNIQYFTGEKNIWLKMRASSKKKSD